MKVPTLIVLTALAALSIAAVSSAAPAKVFTEPPSGQALQRLIQLQQPENQHKKHNTPEKLYFLKVKTAKLLSTDK